MPIPPEAPPISLEQLFEDMLGYPPSSWDEVKAFMKAYNEIAPVLGMQALLPHPELGLVVPAASYDMLLDPANVAKKNRLIQFVTEAFEAATARPLRIVPTPEQVAQAERAYYDNLRKAGIYPTKTPEFEAELAKRFNDILEDFAKGRFGDISPQEWVEALESTVWAGAKLEPEFMAEFKEKQKIGEKFDEAWQRLLSTKGIDVPAELQDSVKALLGKAFVDAAYQNPATTKAESVIVGGFQSAIEQAQTQRQEGFREDALAQFIAEGDYDRAARLIGPPPSPPQATPTEERLQEFFATEEGQEFIPEGYDIKEPVRRAAALADFPTFANATVVSDIELSRRSFEPVLSEAIGRQDPGYQKFLRERFPERLPEEQVIGLRGALQQRPEQQRPEDFAQFIGREFERLRPEFERSQQQQQQQALTKEERQSRSFRSSLFTRYR